MVESLSAHAEWQAASPSYTRRPNFTSVRGRTLKPPALYVNNFATIRMSNTARKRKKSWTMYAVRVTQICTSEDGPQIRPQGRPGRWLHQDTIVHHIHGEPCASTDVVRSISFFSFRAVQGCFIWTSYFSAPKRQTSGVAQVASRRGGILAPSPSHQAVLAARDATHPPHWPALPQPNSNHACPKCYLARAFHHHTTDG